MGSYTELLSKLKQWSGQVATFLRVFLFTTVTQLITLGLDRIDDLRSYGVSAGMALLMILVNWLNPKDKRYGIGADKEE